jgi:hypothetical protein
MDPPYRCEDDPKAPYGSRRAIPRPAHVIILFGKCATAAGVTGTSAAAGIPRVAEPVFSTCTVTIEVGAAPVVWGHAIVTTVLPPALKPMGERWLADLASQSGPSRV